MPSEESVLDRRYIFGHALGEYTEYNSGGVAFNLNRNIKIRAVEIILDDRIGRKL